MPNIIQIKRSTSSASPGSLANGELAFTSLVDVLYIGSPNGSVVAIGGARTPGTLTANQALVANSSGSINEIRAGVANVTSIYANGSLGSGGNILASNGSAIYWTGAGGSGTVTSVDSGLGLTGGPITGTGTLSVLANSGIIANSTGLFVRGANGISVTGDGVNVSPGTDSALVSNSSGLFVTAGAGLLTNSTGIHVGTGNGISVASDSIGVNGGSTLVVNTSGVHVNPTLSLTDLTLSGNLIVNGTTTTVNTENLSVNDSIIELARNNTANTLDIGWYGQYSDDAGSTLRYTGLAWDASARVFELFANTTTEPTTTIDTGAVGYIRATLKSFVDTGAFVSNSTVVNITANSTVSVALVANTLSLTTALPGTSGGTGKSTMTNNALLVGNSSNGFNELTLGTSGYVLQSNGTALVYDVLDGGTF